MEELETNVKKPVLSRFVGSKGKVKEGVKSRGFFKMGRVTDGCQDNPGEKKRAQAERWVSKSPTGRELEPEQETAPEAQVVAAGAGGGRGGG